MCICEQVAASETNYVKQHENSQGANADRERGWREREEQICSVLKMNGFHMIERAISPDN